MKCFKNCESIFPQPKHFFVWSVFAFRKLCVLFNMRIIAQVLINYFQNYTPFHTLPPMLLHWFSAVVYPFSPLQCAICFSENPLPQTIFSLQLHILWIFARFTLSLCRGVVKSCPRMRRTKHPPPPPPLHKLKKRLLWIITKSDWDALLPQGMASQSSPVHYSLSEGQNGLALARCGQP